MNNITYAIVDKYSDGDSTDNSLKNCTWIDIQISDSPNNKKARLSDCIDKENEILARKIDFDINYNIKYLIHILEFYCIKRNKLNKTDIINKIVEFEMLDENKNIMKDRERLFNNFIELKNNKFFNKFIVGDL